MDYMQALAEYERLQAEKNKANPPPTPTPTTTTGLVPWEQLYYSRNIKEVLGWTLATFLEQMKLIRTLPAGSLTAEQMYAVGMYPDMKTARRRKAYNDLVNSTGGSWDNGVLTPPPDWEGSVTDYSKWLSDQLDSMGFGPGTPTGIDTGDGTTGGDEGLTAPETIPPIPVPETFG
ncbi:MAG: hypothetical protein H3Z50_07745, partial [archaeon]|nr:hypothetical protein [archaeon]